MNELLQQCPLCQAKRFEFFKEVPDYFLSKENFQLVKCVHCGLVFIQNRPDKSSIGAYYESEEYISHTDSHKNLFALVYQIVRRWNVAKKYRMIKRYISQGSILDIGCGTGDFLNYFFRKKWNVAGIEPSNSAREIANKKNNHQIFEEEKLNHFADGAFDVISMWHSLEHVHNLNERLSAVHRLLKDDGVFVFSVPIYESWDATHYDSFWAAWDVPRHLYHFSQATVKTLMDRNNFHLLKTIPLPFDSYYISLLSEGYKTKRGSLLRVFLNGFVSNLNARLKTKNFSSLIFIAQKSKEQL